VRLLERLLNLKPSILSRQALAILRSYGTNAHVYLPGIGTINGLTAGNYLLADGSTGATPVDGLVGLELDAAGSVGAELAIPTSSTAGWSQLNATLSSDGTSLTVTNSTSAEGYANSSVAMTIGATYMVSLVVTAAASGGAITIGGVRQALGGLGSKQYFIVATSAGPANMIRISTNGAVAGQTITVNSLSVREVTGTHATASGAARPTLRRDAAGRYSHQFSGAQSLALGSVPFQMADDHAVIAGFNATSAAQYAAIAAPSFFDATNYPCILVVEITTGKVYAEWRSGATVVAIKSASSVLNTTSVLSGRQVGNARDGRLNGVQIASDTRALSATASTAGYIGRNHNAIYSFVGFTGPVIAIKGTVTDADLLTLERFVSSLTPNGPSF